MTVAQALAAHDAWCRGDGPDPGDEVRCILAENPTNSHETAFLAVVRALRAVGYGRMLQLIEAEWARVDGRTSAVGGPHEEV